MPVLPLWITFQELDEFTDAKPMEVHLPTPTGPYEIGVMMAYWADTDELEPRTLDTQDYRQFTASILYPAVSMKMQL